MQIIEIKRGQWLGDIAIRYAGDIETLFEIAVENDISITDELAAGSQLYIPRVTDSRTVEHFERVQTDPASE